MHHGTPYLKMGDAFTLWLIQVLQSGKKKKKKEKSESGVSGSTANEQISSDGAKIRFRPLQIPVIIPE